MKNYDVIIIGGGPAGLNAALYAARKELRAVVITTDFGGQILLTSEIENCQQAQLRNRDRHNNLKKYSILTATVYRCCLNQCIWYILHELSHHINTKRICNTRKDQ